VTNEQKISHHQVHKEKRKLGFEDRQDNSSHFFLAWSHQATCKRVAHFDLACGMISRQAPLRQGGAVDGILMVSVNRSNATGGDASRESMPAVAMGIQGRRLGTSARNARHLPKYLAGALAHD